MFNLIVNFSYQKNIIAFFFDLFSKNNIIDCCVKEFNEIDDKIYWWPMQATYDLCHSIGTDTKSVCKFFLRQALLLAKKLNSFSCLFKIHPRMGYLLTLMVTLNLNSFVKAEYPLFLGYPVIVGYCLINDMSEYKCTFSQKNSLS